MSKKYFVIAENGVPIAMFDNSIYKSTVDIENQLDDTWAIENSIEITELQLSSNLEEIAGENGLAKEEGEFEKFGNNGENGWTEEE